MKKFDWKNISSDSGPEKKEIEMKRPAGSILYVLLSILAAVTQTIDRYPYHCPSVNRFVSSKQNAYFI